MEIDAAEVERVARAMCSARGLDPDEVISGGVNDFGPRDNPYSGFIPAICCYEKRWRTFWYSALDQIAAFRALSVADVPYLKRREDGGGVAIGIAWGGSSDDPF